MKRKVIHFVSHHISKLVLNGEAFERYDLGQEKRLGKLSKINLFVGANNSGKSRFLRSLAAMRPFVFPPDETFNRFIEISKELPGRIKHACNVYNVRDANDFYARAVKLASVTVLTEETEIFDSLQGLLEEMCKDSPLTVLLKGGNSDVDSHAPLRSAFREFAEPFRKELAALRQKVPQRYEFKRVYIPTLRGLRRFGDDDIYANRTRKDYFEGASFVEIFTGLNLYDELRRLLLGTFAERKAAAEFEQFLSDSFFGGQSVTLIPKHDRDVIDVKIGDEPQLPIFNLGDGIQSIIILTFPLFRDKGKSLLLFIEEPELFLHPGLQRVFLNVLQRPDFANAQYFLATHSNHLLDLTLDVESISVFTFRKEVEEGDSPERHARVTVENVSNEDERSLQLLGIQNSSVFLSNCTIWVEGITDRRYLAHYLNLYQQSLAERALANGEKPKLLKQDLHYSFVEYAGANITHFSFLDAYDDAIVVERLCAKLFLVTDKDGEANRAKQERQNKLTESLGDRYYCLKCREVENLLTPEVISAVVRSYEADEVQLKPFTQSSYRSTPLGEFIEEKLIVGKARRAYRSSRGGKKSGTIANKVNFCQRALENIKAFEDLSSEAQGLTRKLYDFIRSRNP